MYRYFLFRWDMFLNVFVITSPFIFCRKAASFGKCFKWYLQQKQHLVDDIYYVKKNEILQSISDLSTFSNDHDLYDRSLDLHPDFLTSSHRGSNDVHEDDDDDDEGFVQSYDLGCGESNLNKVVTTTVCVWNMNKTIKRTYNRDCLVFLL